MRSVGERGNTPVRYCSPSESTVVNSEPAQTRQAVICEYMIGVEGTVKLKDGPSEVKRVSKPPDARAPRPESEGGSPDSFREPLPENLCHPPPRLACGQS